MPKTARSRSPGARVPAALALCLTLAAPVGAADYANGQAAFDAQDYSAAEALWLSEVRGGSTEAGLGLGYIFDLGLTGQSDPRRAFGYYMVAALDGSAAGAFNVGVMLDAGAGRARDPSGAALWYSRAAAQGHVRAAYNLGLLYASGSGVPKNTALAAYWLSQAAASLPAAQRRLAELDRVEGGHLTAPLPLGAGIFAENDRTFADLAWSALPGPAGVAFQVELSALKKPEPVIIRTEASALTLAIDPQTAGYAWRVLAVDADSHRYVASPWQSLYGDDPVAGPRGSVTLRLDRGDAQAASFARELSQSLEGGALSVTVQTTSETADRSTVAYCYDQDMGIAQDVASAISLPKDQVLQRECDPDSLAGVVEVTLVMDGAPRLRGARGIVPTAAPSNLAER